MLRALCQVYKILYYSDELLRAPLLVKNLLAAVERVLEHRERAVPVAGAQG
jgi:hypothetical protein